jgi:uncharacterized protein YdeI (YjbR/CyaY-like superfamily)
MQGKRGMTIMEFASAEQWEAWLEIHHADSHAVWLKIAKKGFGAASVIYDEALDMALCFGWIDGQKDRLDDHFWLQAFSPRRQRSRWSKGNRARAESLIKRGLMRPAGLREVERAKADGRWESAYEGQRTAAVPDDLQRALDENPEAMSFFATLDRLNRYAILYRVQDAGRAETRAKRIERFVDMLARHEKIYS